MLVFIQHCLTGTAAVMAFAIMYASYGCHHTHPSKSITIHTGELGVVAVGTNPRAHLRQQPHTREKNIKNSLMPNRPSVVGLKSSNKPFRSSSVSVSPPN